MTTPNASEFIRELDILTRFAKSFPELVGTPGMDSDLLSEVKQLRKRACGRVEALQRISEGVNPVELMRNSELTIEDINCAATAYRAAPSQKHRLILPWTLALR